MDDDMMSEESYNIDWTTSEDELEIVAPCANREVASSSAASTSYNATAESKMMNHFMEMGFEAHLVSRALEETGGSSLEEDLLETLIRYKDLKEAPPCTEPIPVDSNSDISTDCDFSDDESIFNEEFMCPSKESTPLSLLIEMGFGQKEALEAIEKCGADSPTEELIQYMTAARFREDGDAFEEEQAYQRHLNSLKRKMKKQKHRVNRYQGDAVEVNHLPNPMIGFGVPQKPLVGTCRDIPDAAAGPPYFYFENVAYTPRGVWQKIRHCLYNIEPEFVDSMYFGAACRRRGYVHNLPVPNRFRITPLPPATIHEAFPASKAWWPSWDTRRKLNCLLTCIGSAKLSLRIKTAVEKYSGEPPEHVKQNVMKHAKKWNMIWVGKDTVAPLEPHEMEKLQGFPEYHTRGYSNSDRHRFLGNSFQVDTVAYHLSVLKRMYPRGLNVLSLFSGIGGAEVALYRLGIPLRNVVSVEISEQCTEILRRWWMQTGQRGNLVHVDDVQVVNREMLKGWILQFGGFDLVIGGSPCNNLAGGNRVSRVGLEGEHSSLFYHYVRILQEVRDLMRP